MFNYQPKKITFSCTFPQKRRRARRSAKDRFRKAGVQSDDLFDFIQGHVLPYNGAYDKFDGDVEKAYMQAAETLGVVPKLKEHDLAAELTRLEIEMERLRRQGLPKELQVA